MAQKADNMMMIMIKIMIMLMMAIAKNNNHYVAYWVSVRFKVTLPLISSGYARYPNMPTTIYKMTTNIMLPYIT